MLTELPARIGEHAQRMRALADEDRAAVRALERAAADLHAAIAEATGEGHSLRRIGDAAGLSHERVRRILSERTPAPGPGESSTRMTRRPARTKISKI
jgi:hypothetical protein